MVVLVLLLFSFLVQSSIFFYTSCTSEESVRSVTVVTRLWAGQPRNVVRFPGGTIKLFFFPKASRQTVGRCQTDFYLVGTVVTVL